MVRGAKSGNVHVFHNTCTHRGAVVCRHKSGNAKVFQCFYHAWTFDSDGRLTGVPDRDAYGEKLDFAQLGLRPVARVENYRGFVFASFDENVTDLVTYLAGAREYLDLVIDSGDGQMEIVKGTNEYCIGANWKLLAENSIDGYHAVSTHDTYFKYLVALGTDLKGGVQGTARDLGNGHAVLEYAAPWGRPIAKWEPLFGEHARQEIAVLRAGLVDKYGQERASRMADVNRNLLIYPNLVVNDIMAITVRTFMPSAADRMDVTAWEMAPRDELPAAAAAPARQLPHLPRPGRLRHPGRPGGTRILPAGLQQRRRRVERHLPRHGPGPAGERRGADARVLAAMAAADGRRSLQGGPMISTAHTAAEVGALPAGEPDGGCCATSLHLGSVTRAQIEDFLYREARLLDDWDLDTWLTLWAEEGTRYVVPCNDDPDGDPARDLVLIDDDQLRMRLRVERLNSRKAHREYPHSRTNHQVSNVVVGTAEGSGADAELPVTAAFTVWRFRNGKASYYVGRYHYRFIAVGGELRIRSKRSVLDMTELRPAGDLAIIL